MRVLILGVKFYDFVAKDTGQKINFARIYYVAPDVKERNTKGLVVSELNVSIENAIKFQLDQVNNVPAVYDLDFEIELDYKGQPKPKLVKCEIVSNFNLEKVLNNK